MVWVVVGNCFQDGLRWGEFCLSKRVNQAGREYQYNSNLSSLIKSDV